jgi:uncharacterized repeat protein (TIGR03803 family)
MRCAKGTVSRCALFMSFASLVLIGSITISCGNSSSGGTRAPMFSFQLLYSFTEGADGGIPLAGVIVDSKGNIYGTTYQDGVGAAGVVFRLDPSGSESVLYAFQGAADGGAPLADLVQDAMGNLYGTTAGGGTLGYGVVFKLDPTGKETVLHEFIGGSDGENPHGGVIRDAAGNLYGTTEGGGSGGAGTVFKLDPSGNETILHSFAAPNGSLPIGDLVRDAAGNLYGITLEGGNYAGLCLQISGCGVVYKVDTVGNFTLLHSFSGPDGEIPNAGLTLDSQNNLSGTAPAGGSTNNGLIFKIDASGNETTLYSFMGGAHGASPYGGLVLDSSGNIYGTAQNAGDAPAPFGDGVMFELDTAGKLTVLHTFNGSDGVWPSTTLARDSAGHLYGTAGGGVEGLGVVFKL